MSKIIIIYYRRATDDQQVDDESRRRSVMGPHPYSGPAASHRVCDYLHIHTPPRTICASVGVWAYVCYGGWKQLLFFVVFI